MVSSQFGVILKEFESFFKCPLIPDAKNSCLINMTTGISIQIEFDRSGLVLVGCRLGTLPRGSYREKMIQAALKSHELTPLTTGMFGFSHGSNQLILFMKLNPNDLNADQINNLLPPFIAKAKQWSEAIANSEVPAIAAETAKTPGLFGLIR